MNNTKENLIINFLKLSSENGLKTTSLGLVAEKCEIKKASIYSHFDSKENLQSEAIEYCKKKLAENPYSVKLKGKKLETCIFELASFFIKIFDTKPLKWYYRILEENKFTLKIFAEAELSLVNMLKSHFAVIIEYFVQIGQLNIPDTDIASTILALSFHQQLSLFNVREKLGENFDDFDWEMEKLLLGFLDILKNFKS